MIVAAFSGVGKTFFANLHPDIAVDFVCMPFKYFLDLEAPYDESSKADPNLVMRPDWPFNYVKAILEQPSDKIILIPSDVRVLHLLSKVTKPYYLCYPKRKAKKEYKKRFIKRGNSPEFLSIFIGEWEAFMDGLREDKYGKHIVLKPKQYLSDVLDIHALLGALYIGGYYG
ncbi:MAG: hypothetical protein LBC76_03455 [Treponema sp.]|jgi:hypothetical protein|nr:hypothetical protein [Treponema sp.]